MSDDGFNTTIVLDCGDEIRLNIQPGDQQWEVGWWTVCFKHSQVHGYDPDTGDPEYDRDQQVVEVRPDPSEETPGE